MAELELRQAIRNAIEVEQAAARFYAGLRAKAVDAPTEEVVAQMEAEEREHAAALQQLAVRVEAGQLPEHADHHCRTVETIPAWNEADEITLREALDIALEAEMYAALYYGALADSVGPGGLLEFFTSMTAMEEKHVRRIEELLKRLAAG